MIKKLKNAKTIKQAVDFFKSQAVLDNGLVDEFIEKLEDLYTEYIEVLHDEKAELQDQLVDKPAEIEQAYRNAYTDGYMAAVRQLEALFDGTNGYVTLGQLQDHALKLQMWQTGSVDRRTYAPELPFAPASSSTP